MYHFVKLENNTWYLKVESEQDILDHVNITLRREFNQGFADLKEGMHVFVSPSGQVNTVINHPSSKWRIAVELEMKMKGQSYLEAANNLETKTINDRLELFRKGREVYLSNGLTYLIMNDKNRMEIIDEKWSDILRYPVDEGKHDFDKVEIRRLENGKWGAWVDGIRIKSEYGTDEWSIKAYAIEIARKFCS